MEAAFEEIVSRHLDELYQGAFHLSRSDREEAESLLLDTVAQAAREYRNVHRGDEEAFLERALVRAFMERSRDEENKPDDDAEATEWSSHDEGAEWALTALGALPPRVRAVVWLVVVRRRSYSQVAEFLQVDRESVVEQVREGHRELFRAGARNQGRRASR